MSFKVLGYFLSLFASGILLGPVVGIIDITNRYRNRLECISLHSTVSLTALGLSVI